MPKIDEARMAERPEGVTEKVWRAKATYEQVQAEEAKAPEKHVTRTSTAARDAAQAVLRGEEPKTGSRRSRK